MLKEQDISNASVMDQLEWCNMWLTEEIATLKNIDNGSMRGSQKQQMRESLWPGIIAILEKRRLRIIDASLGKPTVIG